MTRLSTLRSINTILTTCLLTLTSSCAVTSNYKFLSEKFSIDFPKNYHIENNKTDTVIAFDPSKDMTVIVNYENPADVVPSGRCSIASTDFFSRADAAPAEVFGDTPKFILVRNVTMAGGGQGYASLGFYCRQDLLLTLAFVYMSPSKETDDIFSKLISGIELK